MTDIAVLESADAQQLADDHGAGAEHGQEGAADAPGAFVGHIGEQADYADEDDEPNGPSAAWQVERAAEIDGNLYFVLDPAAQAPEPIDHPRRPIELLSDVTQGDLDP